MTERWIGKSVPRVEDGRLLTGRGNFIDDHPPVANLCHAAIVRSPHPHARILGYDLAAALAMEGVVGVITGADVARACKPFGVGVTAPVHYYPTAVDKVRFVGEPVAVVVARDRYLAEDAAEVVGVDYEVLPAVIDPEKALEPGAPILHDKVGTNLAGHRRLVYGDPDGAFADADVVVRERFKFPKYGSTPIETYGVIARWEPIDGVLTIWSNFMGPFIMHPLVARVLQLPENRLRFIVPPDIGGSFGIKSSIYPYLALMGVARTAASTCSRPPAAPTASPGARWRRGRTARSSACGSSGTTTSAVTSAVPSRAVASARPAISSGRTASRTSRWTPRW
jgi:2-furoyl-CoA dehydrogenase large subunit